MALDDLLSRDDWPSEVREIIEREIAEQRRVTRELLVGRELAETITQAQRDTVFVFDPSDGRPVKWNRAFAAVSGYTDDEIAAMRAPDDWYDEADLARAAEATRALQGVGKATVELSLVTKDGRRVPFEYLASRIEDASGRTLILAVGRDTTERRRTERELIESRQRMDLALEGADLGIWEWDVVTGEQVWDRRTVEMLGFEVGELQPGREAAEQLIHPEDFQRGLDALQAHLEGRSPAFEFEHRIRTKSGEYKWVLNRGRVVARDENGKPTRVAGTHLDVTQRRLAEEARRQLEVQVQHAQKLESLGVLAGGVAHDFNNLLVGMLGHSSLALDKLPEGHEARRNIEKVVQAAQRAADLSRQMLAYSGRGDFFVQPTDLNALVQENLQLCEASVPKNVELRADLSRTTPVIEADVGQIQQVVMNLVLNGAEALGDRPGSVTVRTGFETVPPGDKRYSRFTASDLGAGRHVFLEVRDGGPGMDEATLAKIFDPFFSTKFVGRGLGLSAVLGIVRGHRGGIDVTSAPGRGTTFRLLFPSTARRRAREADVDERRPLEGTVLVIDDEELVRETAKEALGREGLNVLTAGSGAEGLELFRRTRAEIGLVILDLSMPGMSGERTFRELRQLEPEVRVLLSSGFGKDEATRRFAGLGLAGFIQKPYRPDVLLGEIRRCIGAARS